MSSVIIKDGTGTGNTASVTITNRLLVDATSEPISDHAADSGDKFNINTGDITLTNATKTTLLYIKNNEDFDLIITTFIYCFGNSTGGSGDCKVDILRNPTTGDIVSNANNALVGSDVSSNLNFGSSKVVSALIYKGATGETALTGDVCISTRFSSSSGRQIVSLGAVILPKGTSLAVNYTPQTGNTSQIVQIAATSYVKTLAVGGF